MDGIDDKLTTISNEDDEGTSYQLFKFKTTCIDDESSDWLASYGDVNRYNFARHAANSDGWLRSQRRRLRKELLATAQVATVVPAALLT